MFYKIKIFYKIKCLGSTDLALLLLVKGFSRPIFIHSLLFLLFRIIIIKNLTICSILNTLAFTIYGKFANHSFDKLWPWSLALAVSALSLKRVCPPKFSPWFWPRTLCPRIHRCYPRCLSASIIGSYLPNWFQ